MSNDGLRIVATTALKILLGHGSYALSPPITSTDLLTKIMTTKLPSSLFPESSAPTPRFKLTDQRKLEDVLEALSQPQAWDEGYISISRDKDTGEMTIWEIGLGPRKLNAGTKRKRIVDEEADSAAGSSNEEEEEVNAAGASSWTKSALGGLNKDMRAVYALLQKSTAKGKLLAEQVSFLLTQLRCSCSISYATAAPFSDRRIRTYMLPRNQRGLC